MVFYYSTACWPGWSAFRCRCFKFYNNAQTWINAEKFCLDYEGNLASAHSHDEYRFIQDLIRYETDASTKSWIGGNDGGHEGVWLWTDGTKMNFQYWLPGEPDNANGNEHCLEMNFGNGHWNDEVCSQKKPFVCVKRTS
ncbi:galactose-specific lectin nattectin-like [Rhinichthys klamathensis goyatoka]|uniref:galactose-specific lectin nattectin-like n=1 Tax=Rhinichthys klamathensis goyatoka TaxID=3034132 RepID=UPI0024B54DBB|nr:galactose-specific lectin nattectin-like [Rhinichthys klamathensis goyatoka]